MNKHCSPTTTVAEELFILVFREFACWISCDIFLHVSWLQSSAVALWLCGREKVWPSPSRNTWPSMCVRDPSGPSVRSRPTSLVCRPRPPSPSRSRPTRWPLPRRLAPAPMARAWPVGAEEEAAVCCRRCCPGQRAVEARCRPWAAWTRPSRSTAVTVTTTVSQRRCGGFSLCRSCWVCFPLWNRFIHKTSQCAKAMKWFWLKNLAKREGNVQHLCVFASYAVLFFLNCPSCII